MGHKKASDIWMVWWALPSSIPINSTTIQFKYLKVSRRSHTPFTAAARELHWDAKPLKGAWLFTKGTTRCLLEGSSFSTISGDPALGGRLYEKALKLYATLTPKEVSTTLSRLLRTELLGVNLKSRSSCYLIPPPQLVGTQEVYDTLATEVSIVGSWYQLRVPGNQAPLPGVLLETLTYERKVIEDNYTGPKYKEYMRVWNKKLELYKEMYRLDPLKLPD